MKRYYVSALDGSRAYFLLGPFAELDEAKAQIVAVRNKAVELDTTGRAWFMGFGACGNTTDKPRRGLMNHHFPTLKYALDDSVEVGV